MLQKYITRITLCLGFYVQAQVGIGTANPHPSAALEIDSQAANKRGVLVPRMTETEKNSISGPATGLLIYQTDASAGFWYFNGTIWIQMGAKGWQLTGNTGTNSTVNKIGTLGNNGLKIVTNNTEAMRITNFGNIGVGINGGSTDLHVVKAANPVHFNDGFEDNTLVPFTTSGTNIAPNWTITNVNPNTGSFSAQSGNYNVNAYWSGFLGTTYNSSISRLDYSATALPTSGTVTFNFKVSSELDNDFFRFYIDGTQMGEWSGNGSWTTVSYPLTAGAHTFRWEYDKDTGTHGYEDRAYIDAVKIELNNAALAIKDGTQGTGKVLYSDANGNAQWRTLTQPATLDNDWFWNSGNTDNDPVYHVGNVKIGDTSTTVYNLHVHNGTTSGSKMSLGSVEFLSDATNEFVFHDLSLTPITNNSFDSGSSTKRWTALYATNGTVQTSDARLKTNIRPLHYGNREIQQLRPVTFRWKKEVENHFQIPNEHKNTHLGFIAQELQTVLPELVQTHQWKEYEEKPGVAFKEAMTRLAVSYSELIPVLTKAIQEQEQQIQELEKLCTSLEQGLAKKKK